MRQRTTPAIALLIGLTQAAPGLSNAAGPGQAPFPDPIGNWGQASNANLLTLPSGNSGNAAGVTAQLSCVDCIRGGQVWCSGRYLAERTAAWAQTSTIATGVLTSGALAADGASAVDRGQCCFGNQFMTLAANDLARVVRANIQSCAAVYTNKPAAGVSDGAATPADSDGTAPITSVATYYWCSSGLSNLGGQSTVGGATSIASPYGLLVPGTGIATTGNVEGDPRTEFWLIACRQRTDQCGDAVVAEGAASTLGVAAVTAQQRPVLLTGAGGGPTYVDKCSWIYRTKIAAPTFQIVSTSATSDALMSSKWSLHYVEYSTQANYGMTYEDAGDYTTKWIFQMHTNFGKLRGRYYDTTMYNGYQVYGDVWQWVNQAGNGTAGPQQNAKRWFPMAVVQSQITAYNSLVSSYNSAKSTFNTDAKKYNDEVKALKAYIADTNVFKAAKKFDVPKRPNAPTRLHAYDGLRVAPWASTSAWTYSGTSNLASVTQNDVVIDGSRSGGWGSFTAGLLPTATEAAGHSFGCFGWSEVATGKDPDGEKRSYLQGLPEMCADTTGAAPALTAQQCPPTSPANTAKYSVVIVSVWANDITAATFATGGATTLQVNFGLNMWAQMSTTWAAPSQPDSPDSLEDAVGAKFLAASATAALAVAAALY